MAHTILKMEYVPFDHVTPSYKVWTLDVDQPFGDPIGYYGFFCGQENTLQFTV